MTTTEWDQSQAKAWSAYIWHHLQDLQMSSSNLAFAIGRPSDVVNEWLLAEVRPSAADCDEMAGILSINPAQLRELAVYAPEFVAIDAEQRL